MQHQPSATIDRTTIEARLASLEAGIQKLQAKRQETAQLLEQLDQNLIANQGAAMVLRSLLEEQPEASARQPEDAEK